jgi:hypothetical protein
MRCTLAAGVAALVLLAAGVSGTVQAQQQSGSGTATYVPVKTKTTELPDGTMLQRVHSQSVVMADDPAAVPFHMSPQDCFGANHLDADGTMVVGRGYCDAMDRDGDVWWIWWTSSPTGGTWGFMGGTGKYAGIEGGGTTMPQGQTPDGRLVITWEGTWEMEM